MKQLKILQEYSSQSYYIDNSLYIEFLDTPICFVLNLHFTEKKFDNDIELEIDLEYILQHYELKNGVVLHGVNIQLIAYERNISLLYSILGLCYEFYQKIPTINIVSDDSGFGCPYNLFYEIKLPSESISYSFLNALKKVKNIQFSNLKFLYKYYEKIEYYGWEELDKHIKINLNEIKSISTQTKSRRLGYVQMILSMFNKSGYYPVNIFNKKIEQEAKEHYDELLEYTNTKGAIDITRTGNSSKPYIETSIALKLIYSQNNAYKLSKYGKILNVLNSKFDNASWNVFKLSNVQQSFFLLFIMKNDGLYLWALLDLIYFQNNKTTFKKLKEVFQQYLIEQLQFTMKNSNLSTKHKSEINIRIKRIKKWKKPEVYLEHVIEPRVNWLLDLELIEHIQFSKNNISLSNKGLILLNTFNSYFDVFLEKSTIFGQLICMDFFDLINEMYEIKAINIIDDDFELINSYISKSFLLFKTMAPNRVTASQAVLYACFMMLFKEKKVVNYCTILNYLKSNKNEKYIFEWYESENDGSIRKKGGSK